MAIIYLLPPLLFIYALPMVLSNTGVLASQSGVYDWLDDTMLPFLLTIMLLKVDILSTIRVMGRGVLVMLCGTVGVILGAPLAYLLVKSHLPASAWKAFGTLAGSWIGGTGNMAAMKEALDASGEDFGLAVLADNAVYIVWLPILLGSKNLANRFHRFIRLDPARIRALEETSAQIDRSTERPTMQQILYLLFLGFAVTLFASEVAAWLHDLVSTGRVLEEKMVLFWHHVFATGAGKVDHYHEVITQIDMFREKGMGSYRELLLALAKNPAMIFWLDNCDNHSYAVNENWGRE
ncbi:MAG: DUF819 family protein, partial [Planctomycetes bacterium]|nr:DUF819 family protein [Planctomycetota bacterium]